LALTEIDKANSYLATAKSSNETNNINTALTQTVLALNKIQSSLNSLFAAVNTASPGSSYEWTTIDAVKASIRTDQTSMSSAITSVQNAQSSLNSAINSYQAQVDTATAAINTTQNNLNTALATKDVQLSQSKTTVDNMLGSYNLAKAQYGYKAATPRYVDIASYRAQVASAAASLELAKQTLADYVLKAPTAGIITFVNYTAGEQPTSVKPVISMLGTNKFYVETDIPESDIPKLKIENPVSITLDAYSDDIKFTGKVILIYPAETIVQDVVYYKVKVELDSSSYEVKSGMTANCDILTAQKENVMQIPYRAVVDQDGVKSVKVLENNKVVVKTVTIGLRGDEGEVEVLSGLNLGEKVITFEKILK